MGKSRTIELMEDGETIGCLYKNYNEDYNLVCHLLELCFNYVVGCDSDDKETTLNYMKELGEMAFILHNCEGEDFGRFWVNFVDTGVFHDAVGELVNITPDEFEIAYEY